MRAAAPEPRQDLDRERLPEGPAARGLPSAIVYVFRCIREAGAGDRTQARGSRATAAGLGHKLTLGQDPHLPTHPPTHARALENGDRDPVSS